MQKLLKHAVGRNFSTTYSVKLYEDDDRYFVYANNSNFNWGYVASFTSKEDAESDFYHTLQVYKLLNWKEIK
jgi:hypothetical protein